MSLLVKVAEAAGATGRITTSAGKTAAGNQEETQEAGIPLNVPVDDSMEKGLTEDFESKYDKEALVPHNLDVDENGEVVDPNNDVHDNVIKIYLKQGVDLKTLPEGPHSNIRPGDKESPGLQVGPKNDGRLEPSPHPEKMFFANYMKDLEERTGVQHSSEENLNVYDYVGLFKDPDRDRLTAISPEDGQVHLSDKYKLPSHPTFTTESVYYKNQEETPAGTWGDQGEFIPSPAQLGAGFRMEDLPPEMRPVRVLEGTSLEQATNTGPFLQREEKPLEDTRGFEKRFIDILTGSASADEKISLIAENIQGGLETFGAFGDVFITETPKLAATYLMETVESWGQYLRDIVFTEGLDFQELLRIFTETGPPGRGRGDIQFFRASYPELAELSGSPWTQMTVDLGAMVMVGLITKAFRAGTLTSISTGDVLGGPEENLVDLIPPEYRSAMLDSLRSNEDAPAFINRLKKIPTDILFPEALFVSLGVAYKGLKKTGQALSERGAVNLFGGSGRAVFAASRNQGGEVVWRKAGEQATPGWINVLKPDGTMKPVRARDYMPDPDADFWGFPDPPKTLPDDHLLLRETINLPGREQMRADMVAAAVSQFGRTPKGRKPILYLKGGGGGSGKGSVDKKLKKEGAMPDNIGEVNPDDIKLAIPEFEQIVRAGDSRGAGTVHEESSLIAKAIEAEALSRQVDFIIDKVLGDPVKAKATIEKFKANGYEIRLIGVTIPVEEAAIRARTRANGSGRFVPMKQLFSGHLNFSKAFRELEKMADESVLYDNMPPKPVLLARRKKGGKFKIKHKAAWADFLTKEKINVEAKTLNGLRDESLKFTGTGPSGSVPGRNNRGAASRGEPGDGGLDPRGSGKDERIIFVKEGLEDPTHMGGEGPIRSFDVDALFAETDKMIKEIREEVKLRKKLNPTLNKKIDLATEAAVLDLVEPVLEITAEGRKRIPGVDFDVDELFDKTDKIIKEINESVKKHLKLNPNLQNKIDLATESRLSEKVGRGTTGGPVAQASILGPILRLFDDAPWNVIKGERGSVKNPFVRTMADEGQEIPLEVRQYVQTEGRVYDIASRLSINWDRINTAKDVKGTWAGARSVAADEIAEAAGEVRKLEDVADEARVALAADPAGELARLQKIKAELGFSDVDLTEMRILETASAIELTQLKTLVLDNFPGAGEKLKAHWARHVMIMSQRQAMSATSSRIFGAGRIGVTGEEVGERAIADAVQNMADVAPTDIEASQLAIWLHTLKTPEEITEMARIAAAPGFGKMLLEAWIAGLLTSPKTHIVNTVSNTLMQLNHNFVDRPMAAAVGVFRTGSDKVRFGETKEAMFGLLEAMREAWKMSKRAFITGDPQSELTKIEIAREPAITSKNIDALLKRYQQSGGLRGKVLPSSLDEAGPLGRAVDMFANWGIRMSFRALQSSDEFFKTFAYRMEVNQLAYRQAVKEGHEGTALAERIYELKRNPSPDIKHGAETTARYLTFTNELGKMGQAGTKFVDKTVLFDAIPIGRMVVPFIRTPTNISKYTLERIPGLNLVLGEVRKDLAAGGARADMTMGRMMLGGYLMLEFGKLAADGMITGSAPQGPENAGMRAARRRLKMLPNSLRLTDDEGNHHYYSFSRGDPFGMLMGLSADFKLIMQEADQQTADEVALAMGVAFSEQIVNKTWAQGVDNFMGMMRDFNRYGPRYVNNLVRTVVPRIVATWGKPSGSNLQELDTYLQIVKGELGLCETCPNKLNFWAEEITRDGAWGPDFFSPFRSTTEKKDFVDQEIVAQDMSSGIGKHPRIIGKVKMTPLEYNQFKRIFATLENSQGQTIKVRLEELIRSDRYQAMTNGRGGGKANLILDRIQKWQDSARMVLLRQNLALASRVDEKVMEKRKALYGNKRNAQPDIGLGLIVR